MSYQKLTPITAKGATEPRYLEDRFADTSSVKDFGAVGDGITDDSQAIQNALNAASGRSVVFPAGTYIILSTIEVFQDTLIRGIGHAVLKSTDPQLEWVVKIQSSNVTIENLYFYNVAKG